MMKEMVLSIMAMITSASPVNATGNDYQISDPSKTYDKGDYQRCMKKEDIGQRMSCFTYLRTDDSKLEALCGGSHHSSKERLNMHKNPPIQVLVYCNEDEYLDDNLQDEKREFRNSLEKISFFSSLETNYGLPSGTMAAINSRGGLISQFNTKSHRKVKVTEYIDPTYQDRKDATATSQAPYIRITQVEMAGLFGLTPGEAETIGIRPKERYDPEIAGNALAAHLSRLHQEIGDIDWVFLDLFDMRAPDKGRARFASKVLSANPQCRE